MVVTTRGRRAFLSDVSTAIPKRAAPKEKATFTSGNVSALAYPAGNWNKDKMVVKFGRWQSRSNAFFLSGLFLARGPSGPSPGLPSRHTSTSVEVSESSLVDEVDQPKVGRFGALLSAACQG